MPTRQEVLKSRMAAQAKALIDSWESGEDCVFCDEDGTEKVRAPIRSLRFSERIEDGVLVTLDHASWPMELSAFQVAPSSATYEDWKTLGVPKDDPGPVSPPVMEPAEPVSPAPDAPVGGSDNG